jgi:hypothetical protein
MASLPIPIPGQEELDPSVKRKLEQRSHYAKRMREMLKRFPTRADHPRWVLDDAMRVYRELYPVLSKAGWLTAFMGSVVRDGEGQDLDLMLVPWKMGATRDEAIMLIERELNAECVSRVDEGVLTEECGFYTKQIGLLVDVVFCSGRCGPRFLRDETTRQKG